MAAFAFYGSFDAKVVEHGFIADAIRSRGHDTLLIHVGSFSEATIEPDISAEEVAAASGEDWRAVLARRDRGECVSLMARAAAKFVAALAESGRIKGIISLG